MGKNRNRDRAQRMADMTGVRIPAGAINAETLQRLPKRERPGVLAQGDRPTGYHSVRRIYNAAGELINDDAAGL